MNGYVNLCACVVVLNSAGERCFNRNVAASERVFNVLCVPGHVESLRRHVDEQVEVFAVRSLEVFADSAYIAVEQGIVLGVLVVDVELDACVILLVFESAVHFVDAGISRSVGIREAVAFLVGGVVIVLICADCFLALVPPRICCYELCADVEGCRLVVVRRVVDGVFTVGVHVLVVLVRTDGHIVVSKVAVGERNLGYANLDRHLEGRHDFEVLFFAVPHVDGHLSVERCAEVCKISCRGRVLVRNEVVALVAVCKRERHSGRESVCACVCKVVVIDVFFGHTGRLGVDDVDIPAVRHAAVHADERIRDGRILAFRVQVFESRSVEHELCVNDRTIEHRDGYVDALFCEHISCFVRQLEVFVVSFHEVNVVLDGDVGLDTAAGDVSLDVTAVRSFDADDCRCHVCGVARAALDELVNV
ncbi:unknown [Firmicutes bacterium CAG:475]|nr:unknown [Firmicutes bacterium CAG:475]